MSGPGTVSVERATPIDQMTVAVVGTGRMGSAMAMSLARAGARLVLFNRTPDRAREAAHRATAASGSHAAEVVATPAEAARRAMTREPLERWDPLVCIDARGRYVGIVRVERLVDELSNRASNQSGAVQ